SSCPKSPAVMDTSTPLSTRRPQTGRAPRAGKSRMPKVWAFLRFSLYFRPLQPSFVLRVTGSCRHSRRSGPGGGRNFSPCRCARRKVIQAMLLKKLWTVVTLFLVVTLLGGGGALLAHRALGAAPADKADKKDRKAKSDKDLLQGTWIEAAGRKNKDGEEVPEE